MKGEINFRFQAMRLWLRPLGVMTLKELRQLFHDRAVLVIIIYIFTFQIFVSAGEIATELKDAVLLVRDSDRSSASRELIYRFQPPYFQLKGGILDEKEGLRLLDEGEATLFMEIPHEFHKTLSRASETATVQLLVDTSKSNIGYLASTYSARIAGAFGNEWAQQNLLREGFDVRKLPAVLRESRIWYNTDLNEAWFGTIVGLMSMITVACILLPATSMVREKERGTIEQLLVSPLSPFQVMFSKMLAMILVTLAGTAIALFGIIQAIYGMPIRGSVFLFFVLTALYAFTTAGMGLLAATFTRSSGQVGMIVLFIVMPIINLSGVRTPIESMPQWLQHCVAFFPMRHFAEVTYGTLLHGAGLNIFWDSILKMALLGGGLFAAGLWRFRHQFE